MKIVALTGAGISAESGLATFRSSGGLWNQYRIEDVASIDAWNRDPKLVLEFYNMRRRELAHAKPNAAHLALTRLAEFATMKIITQNVDDLHEKAGSKDIIHLHGELTKVRSSLNDNLIYPVGYQDICLGDLAPDGSQLRPHIVWFGEAVPLIPDAIEEVLKADMIIIIGTSMQVYPAAGLIQYAGPGTEIIYIDPEAGNKKVLGKQVRYLNGKAGDLLPPLVEELRIEFDKIR